MESRIPNQPVVAFCELAEARLNLPVPAFHSRWLEGQLASLACSWGFSDIASLVEALGIEDLESQIWGDVIHGITVHETYWMRNSAPLLHAVQCFGSNVTRLRILSLGCAYGQEAYTAYVLARNSNPEADIRVRGIDLSKVCTEFATKGRFKVTQDFQHLQSHLHDEDGCIEGEHFEFASHIRERMSFSVGNLLDPYVAGYKEYDLILCQNCLTYYDPEVRGQVAKYLVDSLEPGGLLVFAGAELMGIRPEGVVRLSSEWTQIFVKEF